MRAPDFWFTPPDRPALAARLLQPLGRLYAAATARRLRGPSWRAPVPVICVGNLNAGGTGKTPMVIALAQRLGAGVHVVSRGHGGRLAAAGAVRVDPARHTAADTGDEPLLLARFAPVWVARDRAEGVRAAVAGGARLVVMDDGFQNPAVAKDISLIVVDAGVGFGNGRCLPAGPLREPVATGLARADLVVSIGPAQEQARFAAQWGARLPVPWMTGHLAPVDGNAIARNERLFAFAGIGRPEKFFATLRGLGADLVATRALADHQPLDQARIEGYLAQAEALQARPITTEKDAMRLPPPLRERVSSLPVRLQIADWRPFDVLADRLGKGPAAR